jgi:hypothetical protein
MDAPAEDNSNKHCCEHLLISINGACGAGVVEVFNELQTFVGGDGIGGAGLASGAIVGGHLACDRRR